MTFKRMPITYDWKTEEGRSALGEKLRQLLSDVDSNPDRPDNPVSDFLQRTAEPRQTIEPADVAPSEVAIAQPLAGIGAEGLDAIAFAGKLIAGGSSSSVNPVLRLTRNQLNPMMQEALNVLNQRKTPQRILEPEISDIAAEYYSSMEPYTHKIEEFILACIEQDWLPGSLMGLQLSSDWISLSEHRGEGRRVRLAQGVPALLAWRLLILMGAQATSVDAFSSLATILNEPIQVEHLNNRFSHLPLPRRSDLFHPEAFLGHANLGIEYIANLWPRAPHLHEFFRSEEEYHLAISKFLMIVALMDSRIEEEYPLYAGYRLIPHAKRAMGSLCSKLATSEPYLQRITEAMGESPSDLRGNWSSRAARANRAQLGSKYWPGFGVRFPDPMDAQVEDL